MRKKHYFKFLEHAEVTSVEELSRCRKINEYYSTYESMWYAIKLQQRILQLIFDNRNKSWDDLVKKAVQTYHTLWREYYVMTFEYHAKKHLILLADEDREIRKLLCQVLEKNNYTVICASNGKEILKLVQYQPQLIILDVYQPLPSLKVCKRLRNLKAYSKYGDIPIILLKAKLSEKYQSLIKQLGRIDWIAKPARMNDLLQQIKKRIPLQGIEMTL